MENKSLKTLPNMFFKIIWEDKMDEPLKRTKETIKSYLKTGEDLEVSEEFIEMDERSLIISIHDFNPKFRSELEEILSELDIRGFTKRSILVIPSFQGFTLRGNKKILELLYNEIRIYNEICLHGYEHYKYKRDREFKHISYNEAVRRLRLGKKELQDLGTMIEGFVPPYYKISSDGEDALRNESFTFVVKNPVIKDLRDGSEYVSRAIWFWPHSLVIDHAFRLFDEFLAKVWNENNDLVRVDVHPEDLHKSKPFDYALKLIKYLNNERMISSYKEFLDSKRKERYHNV